MWQYLTFIKAVDIQIIIKNKKNNGINQHEQIATKTYVSIQTYLFNDTKTLLECLLRLFSGLL